MGEALEAGLHLARLHPRAAELQLPVASDASEEDERAVAPLGEVARPEPHAALAAQPHKARSRQRGSAQVAQRQQFARDADLARRAVVGSDGLGRLVVVTGGRGLQQPHDRAGDRRAQRADGGQRAPGQPATLGQPASPQQTSRWMITLTAIGRSLSGNTSLWLDLAILSIEQLLKALHTIRNACHVPTIVGSDASALWRQRGILVDRTYADMVCAPSRASFIAGRPSHLVQPKVFSRSQEVYTSAGSTNVSSSGSTAQAVAGMILGDADAKAQLHWLPELHGRQVALRRASGSPANLARLQPLLRAHEPDGSHTLLFIAMSDIID